MSLRVLYLMICGIILAGIVHISIILLIPDYGSRDAWNIISRNSDLWRFREFSNNKKLANALEDTDPYLPMGACTFDLSVAGLQLTGGQSKSFWSLSVFDQDGKVMYSLNSRTAIENRLDLIVLNPVQMIALREAPPLEVEHSVVIEADIDKGFVVLRQFQSDVSRSLDTADFMAAAHCQKYFN